MDSIAVCIIDRFDGHGDSAPALERLSSSWNVQRLLPDQVENIRSETQVIFVRAAYFGDLAGPIQRLHDLQWVHVAIAGTEHLPKNQLTERGVSLTNSAGVLDDAIGEFVAASVLLWSKGLLRSMNDSAKGQLVHREPMGNEELRVLVVGAGGIGSASARTLRTLGVSRLAGVRRDPTALDPVFDEHVPGSHLASRVSDFNVIVASLPSSSATANMLSSQVIGRFADPWVFVNVGRGASVDHDALTEALRRNPQSAAVLDVTEPEPLPPGHPLWHLPNAVISPHMAGDTTGRHDRYALLFEENLHRFSRGEPLLNRLI